MSSLYQLGSARDHGLNVHDVSICYRYDKRGKEIQERYKVNFSSPDEARRVVDEALDHDNGKLYYLENESIEVSVKRDGVSHKKWKVWGSPVSSETFRLVEKVRIWIGRTLTLRRFCSLCRQSSPEFGEPQST